MTMHPDLTLHLSPSAVGTATCSATNNIALCTGSKIHILSSSPSSVSSKSPYAVTEIDIGSGRSSTSDHIAMEETEETWFLGSERDAVAVAAEWSPIGLSKTNDCLLAVLDSHHYISLWEHSGQGITGTWINVKNLLETSIMKFFGGVGGRSITAGPLTAEQIGILKAHCVAWSPLLHIASEGKNEAFMAVGNAVGSVNVWRYTQPQGLEFKLDWNLPDSEAGIVTHVAWSPWFSLHVPKSSKTSTSASILAASQMDGSIHLCLITHVSTVGTQEIQFNTTRELLSPQRIGVMKLAWTRRNDDLILAIARNGLLSLSIHSVRANKPLTSKLVTHRHNNFSPAAAIIMTPSLQGSLDILLISQLLPISFFNLSTSNELNLLPPPPEIEIFFSNKHDEYSPKGMKSIFRIFGANATYNAAFLNIYFELVPNDRPQYRRFNDLRSRLSSVTLGSVEENIQKHLQRVRDVINDCQITFAKYAWEARAIMENASTEQKNFLVEEYLKLYEEIEKDAANAMTDVQSSTGDFNFDCESIHHWQYWITLDTIVKLSLNELLSDDFRTRLTNKTNSATSIIRQHIHKWLQSMPPSSFLSLVQGIYASFDAAVPDTSPEICGICGERIPAKSISFGSCAKGHIFQRCSKTLLTLSTPYVMTCRVCGRKLLDKRAFSEDSEWQGGLWMNETHDEILSSRHCLYCAGELVQII